MDSSLSADLYRPHRPLSPASSRLTLASAPSGPHSTNENETTRPTPLQATRLIKIEVHRKLTWWDVSALIINKMIGTGIFTGPPTVLSYAGSRKIALGIWAGGFIYTLISMLLYLEFSRKLPYTGGELVYLDELIPRPALLAYTCYALYFICIYTTATNSMQFGRQAILASTGETEVRDERVMRFIAVVISSVVCLLLYFSTATGRRLNRYLAWIKIGLMITIFVAGAIRARVNRAEDVDSSNSEADVGAAVLQVLFAFQGWENATLVAGEIPDHGTLRKGFIRAVWIVGLIYLLINIVYCYAIPFEADGSLAAQYVPHFFGNSSRARQSWAILTALSAVGSMISVTYTCVRVKQSVAWSNILPWSPFWRTSAPVRTKEPRDAIEMRRLLTQGAGDDEDDMPTLRTGAPQGGLIMHWISCIFYISLSSAISNVSEAISFSAFLLTYAHALVGLVIGALFPWFRNVLQNLPEERGWEAAKEPSRWLRSRLSQFLFGWIYAAGSLALLILAAITSSGGRVIKGWYFPIITFGFIFLSMLYYLAFLASEDTTAVHLAGVKLKRQLHGADDNENIMRQCDFCIYHEPGEAHRHARDGYLHYNDLNFPYKDKGRNGLYWAFGGPKERHQPDLHMDDHVLAAGNRVVAIFGGFFNRTRGLVPSFKRDGSR